jgi:hypothetical protein
MRNVRRKVFAGLGVKFDAGQVKINVNTTLNAQTSADGRSDSVSLQGTVGAKAGDVGAHAGVTAPIYNSDGLVNPLTNLKGSTLSVVQSEISD